MEMRKRARRRASFYDEQYSQSSIDLSESEWMEEAAYIQGAFLYVTLVEVIAYLPTCRLGVRLPAGRTKRRRLARR
jgi:hypothetical protein